MLEGSRNLIRWMTGLLVVVALVVAWRLVRLERIQELHPPPDPAPASPAEAPRGGAELVHPEKPAEPGIDPPEEDAPQPSRPADEGSPLERALADVTGSFLTSQPRVADLLDLSHELAASSSVDPESVQVERDEEGALRFARGTLLVGDMKGTFLFEEGLYIVRFSGAASDLPWGQRDLQITLSESQSQATSCQASVQFHPREEELASRHLGAGEEKLAGWGVSVSPETGALARPMTVSASGDAWQIGSGRGVEALELPWISGTTSFEAWLRLLRPYTER